MSLVVTLTNQTVALRMGVYRMDHNGLTVEVALGDIPRVLSVERPPNPIRNVATVVYTDYVPADERERLVTLAIRAAEDQGHAVDRYEDELNQYGRAS